MSKKKLLRFGVRGKISDILISIYKNVKSKVKYNSCLSEEFTFQTGVRQGESYRHFFCYLCK